MVSIEKRKLPFHPRKCVLRMKAIMRRNYICVKKNLYILYKARAFFEEKQRKFYHLYK